MGKQVETRSDSRLTEKQLYDIIEKIFYFKKLITKEAIWLTKIGTSCKP